MQKQQPNRKVLLFLATLVVLAGIVWGALFLIAPIWRPGTPVAYMPALPQTEAAAESAPTQLVDLNTADAETLQTLPGIGPATAAGVMAFAHNRPAVYVETNVRTVFIHCLFPGRDRVADREIVPLVADTCPEDDPRSWYYALLDYGAHLKQEVANPSRRSAHHTRQSAFEGSRRQKRAEVLRVVLAEPGIPLDDAHARLNAFEAAGGRGSVDRALFESIVDDLVSEGFFRRDGQTLTA